MGTSTVAPNMANMCWSPRISTLGRPSTRASRMGSPAAGVFFSLILPFLSFSADRKRAAALSEERATAPSKRNAAAQIRFPLIHGDDLRSALKFKTLYQGSTNFASKKYQLLFFFFLCYNDLSYPFPAPQAADGVREASHEGIHHREK